MFYVIAILVAGLTGDVAEALPLSNRRSSEREAVPLRMLANLVAEALPLPNRRSSEREAVPLQEWNRDPVSATIVVSTRELTVAERLTLVVSTAVPAASLEETLRTGNDRVFQFESLSGQLRQINGLRLLSESPAEEVIDGGMIRSTAQFDFEPRRPGDLEIPALNLVFASANAPPIVIRTDPVKIAVRSLVDGDPLKAVPRGPVALPEEQGSGMWAWLLAILLAAAAWFHQRCAAASIELPMPLLSPREAALASLERSTEPGRWVEILRDYLAACDERRITPGDRATLVHLLGDLDAIRFAADESSKPTQVRERLQNFIRTMEL